MICTIWKVFIGEGRTRKLLAKQRKGLFQARSPSLGGKVGGLIRWNYLIFGGMERTLVTDYLIGVYQKISD